MAGRRLHLQASPEAVRQVAAGEVPLRALAGVSDGQIAAMATFGSELCRQGRHGDAAKVIQGIVALDDSIYYGHAGLGWVAMQLDRLAEAEAHLTKAAFLAPADASVAANLGETLLRRGQVEEAVAVLDRAIRLGERDHDPGTLRAKALLAGIRASAMQR